MSLVCELGVKRLVHRPHPLLEYARDFFRAGYSPSAAAGATAPSTNRLTEPERPCTARNRNMDPPSRSAFRIGGQGGPAEADLAIRQQHRHPVSHDAADALRGHHLPAIFGLVNEYKDAQGGKNFAAISSALASCIRSSPWKNHSMLMPWQTPQWCLTRKARGRARCSG